ncbi:CAP domain-containing protein [Streptomyces sp. NPDC012637]|uniref:CAP domain-containing protein n=1 Tax=Streptomyces sp. NPDC012637 TaxID=3364842 RepID=UPI0036E24392
MKPSPFAAATAVVCGLVLMAPGPAASAGAAAVAAEAATAPASVTRSALCPTPQAPPGTGSRVSAADAEGLVRAHNEARREAVEKYHPGLPVVSVSWDPKLACDAQAWADGPASSAGGTLHHSGFEDRGREGENLLNSYPGPARPLVAVDPAVHYSWTAEKAAFDADGNAPVDGTNYRVWGHYSQMVWMSSASPTTTIGCGVKEGVPVSGNTGWILVCRYAPAGNRTGERAIPPGGEVVAPAGSWNARAQVATDAVGDPATMVTPNQQHVFYRSEDGAIKHLFWDASANRVFADDWSRKAGAAADVAGNPATMVWPGQQHVFYRSTAGTVRHLFWDANLNRVFAEDWSQKAGVAADVAGDPATMVTPNQQHVFYRSTAGTVRHLFWDASANRVFAEDWSQKAGVAADVAGDPATMVTPNQQHVFYRSTAGTVRHLFWDASANRVFAEDWSQKAGVAADVAGDPATMVTPNQQHVFYRSTAGTVRHLFWDASQNRVYADDWSRKAGAAADVAGNPATMVWPGQQHVFYRSTSGAIGHLFWDAGQNRVFAEDWSRMGRVAADATDDPATLVWPNQQHVFYRSDDGAIKHLFWDAPANRVFSQ